MPQVYLAVNDGRRYLIVRKQILNAFWNGAVDTPPAGTPLGANGFRYVLESQGPTSPARVRMSAVNQAGQWALPGGRLHFGETPVVGALREFREETGIDFVRFCEQRGDPYTVQVILAGYSALGHIELVSPQHVPMGTPVLFYAVEMETANAALDALRAEIDANTAPLIANRLRPAGAYVIDWEQSTSQVVDRTGINPLGQWSTVTTSRVNDALLIAGIDTLANRAVVAGLAAAIQPTVVRFAIDWYQALAAYWRTIGFNA